MKHQISEKLAPKYDKCLFMGYSKETKGYYFYNASENKVFVARNCVFLEREFISEPVGAQCNLKKFKTHKLALYLV